MAETERRGLEALLRSGTTVGLTDGEVLRRAGVASGEESEAFFRTLVERHGPMVRRVCRGVLGDEVDADDAFQATFLVLARRLREAQRLESVGGWLHGVAARVSARARADASRRRKRERESGRFAVVAAPEADGTDPERDHAVREEVGRLPSRYREVVVLCFWEGLTQEQAAGRIGCPIGTVRSRSARARDLLRRRLARRGVAPEGIDARAVAPLALLPALVRSAARAASETAAGRSASNLVNARAFELSRIVARSMTMTKLVPIGAAAAILLAAAVGIGRAGGRDAPDAATPVATQQPPAANPPAPAAEREEYVVETPDVILVEVLEALEGRPISGERLVRGDGRISLGFYGEVPVAGLTLRQIKAAVALHLKKWIGDDLLGLVEEDPKTGRPRPIAPEDTDRIFVDVTAYNSKNYYAIGLFNVPGKYPIAGDVTVLDAVLAAGGLSDAADHARLAVVRDGPDEGPKRKQRWVVDLDRIITGEDPSMNHRLRPGDRLVAVRKASVEATTAPAPEPGPEPEPESRQAPASTLGDLDRRLERIETLLQELTRAVGK